MSTRRLQSSVDTLPLSTRKRPKPIRQLSPNRSINRSPGGPPPSKLQKTNKTNKKKHTSPFSLPSTERYLHVEGDEDPIGSVDPVRTAPHEGALFMATLQEGLKYDGHGKKKNTNIAYDRHIKDYYQFCDAHYSGLTAQFRYIVSPDSCHKFLNYIAFRPLKKRGKRKVAEGFDIQKFNAIFSKIQSVTTCAPSGVAYDRGKQLLAEIEPAEGSGVTYSSINQAHFALTQLWLQQKELGGNSHSKDEVFGHWVKQLKNYIDGRKERQKRSRFALKMKEAPYEQTLEKCLPEIASQLAAISTLVKNNGVVSGERSQEVKDEVIQGLIESNRMMCNALEAATNVYTNRKINRDRLPISFPVDLSSRMPLLGDRFVGDGFQLPPVTSAKGLWDCWHGKGKHEDIPIEGGVSALDNTKGKCWRKGYSSTQMRMYNRYKKAVMYMREEKVGYTDNAAFFKELDGMFTKISPFEKLMKKRSDERAQKFLQVH